MSIPKGGGFNVDISYMMNLGNITTTNASELGHIEESKYLVKNWLYKDGIAMIYGASNSGKSFLAIDIAMHIAYGTAPWNKQRTKQGHVIYMAAEGHKSVERRVIAFMDRYEKPTANLDIIHGLDLVTDDEDAMRLSLLASISKTSLIVVDTLAMTLAGADENSAKEIGEALVRLRKVQEDTGATVLLIHHSGKDHTRGARGSSALRAAVDTEIEVRAGEVDGVKIHAARVTKQRDAERADEFTFRLNVLNLGIDEDGDAITSCIVESSDLVCPEHDTQGFDAKPKKLKMPVLQKIAIDALDDELTRSPGGVPTIQWRDAFRMLATEKLGDTPDKHVWASNRAALEKKKLVTFNKEKNTYI